MLVESTPRVLVADDQAHVLMALRRLLADEGFEADTAASAQEIRERLGAVAYDLLLMDLNYARDTTSGREGLDLLGEVHARDPLLPVVVMTGWGSIETAVEAIRRGARAFVQKPWENEALSDTLRREIEQGRVARREHGSVSREQEDALAVQRALLPATEALFPGGEIVARWSPAASFSGDFYDVLRLGDGRLALAIGDVCGKGLPAALLMASVQASMRAFAAADPSPRVVASRLNRELATNARLCRLVTCFYAVYDVPARRLTYANAGHHPPILARADRSVARLTEGGMVLGAFEAATYDEESLTLESGDRIVLFTDGLVEPTDSADREFGDDRLAAAVSRWRDAPARCLADGVFEEVTRFAGGRLEDDATLVAVAIS